MSWHGEFCWYELMAPDADAAQAFYEKAVGWQSAPSGMPGMDYRLFLADGVRSAGLMPVMDGGPSGWVGYVAVDDCDATAARAGELGGTVHRAPADIPGIGRFAILADPQGALLAIIAPVPPEDATAPPAPGTPGRCGWHELHARDWEAAWTFYEALFGWTKSMSLDMGPMGTYQIFRKDADGPDVGAMMTVADAPRPHWRFYFSVTDLDAATEAVRAGGGTVQHGPIEVSGGSWITMCLDPHGASFALMAPAR